MRLSGFFDAGQRGLQAGQEQRTRRTLGEYMQPALGGDQAAQQAIYGADPEMGYKVQQQAQQQAAGASKAAQEEFAQFSRLYASAPEPMRQQMYSGWRERAIKAGLPAEIPEAYDPESVKLAQALAGGGEEEYTLSPGGKRFRGNTLIAEAPFAPQPPEYQFYEGADGPAWLPKPTGAPQGAPQVGGPPTPSQPNRGPGSLDINGDYEQFASLGIPVSSTRRDPQKNASVGGVGNSYHLTGEALDIAPRTAQEKRQAQQYWSSRGYQVIDEGDHLHVEPPKRGMTTSQIGGGAIPIPGVRPKPKAADAPSALQERIELARSMGATEAELRQMVIGKEGAAAGAKPMPVAALKIIKDETDAANTATAINTSLDKHLIRIESGKLDFGPVANTIYAGRNAAGMSTEESRNFAEFKSDLEKLRNDSLRLNAGVQTDGDAQRAWNELIANINDTDYVKQRLQTIKQLNDRARSLRQLNAEMVRENYGRGESQAAPADDDFSNLWGGQ